LSNLEDQILGERNVDVRTKLFFKYRATALVCITI